MTTHTHSPLTASDDKQGQTLEAKAKRLSSRQRPEGWGRVRGQCYEAEAKIFSSRPKPEGLGRVQGQCYEAEAKILSLRPMWERLGRVQGQCYETEAKVLSSRPKPEGLGRVRGQCYKTDAKVLSSTPVLPFRRCAFPVWRLHQWGETFGSTDASWTVSPLIAPDSCCFSVRLFVFHLATSCVLSTF